MRIFAIAAAIFLLGSPVRAGTTAETAAQSILAQFTQHWQAADAHGLADLFAPDADLVTPDGVTARGRENIAGFYAHVFESGYRGSKAEGHVVHARMLSPDMAILDAGWRIEVAKAANGTPRPVETGILAAVIGKDGRDKNSGGWKIRALRENAGAAAFSVFPPSSGLRADRSR